MNPNDPRFTPPPNPNNPHPYPYGLYNPPAPQHYPQPQIAPSDNQATTIFILGLLGVMFCALLAPIAWIQGSSYRSTCRIMEVQPNGLATAGWVLGIIGTVLLMLSLVFVALSVALS